MVEHDLPWWECQPNSGLLNLIGRYLLRTAVPALAGTAHLQIFRNEIRVSRSQIPCSRSISRIGLSGAAANGLVVGICRTIGRLS